LNPFGVKGVPKWFPLVYVKPPENRAFWNSMRNARFWTETPAFAEKGSQILRTTFGPGVVPEYLGPDATYTLRSTIGVWTGELEARSSFCTPMQY